MPKKQRKEVRKAYYIQNLATRESPEPKFVMITRSEYDSIRNMFRRWSPLMRIYRVRFNKRNYAYDIAMEGVKLEKKKILKERSQIVTYHNPSLDQHLKAHVEALNNPRPYVPAPRKGFWSRLFGK